MKKFVVCCSLCLMFAFTGGLSYAISKGRAERFAQRYSTISLSPLKGQLVFFIDGNFKPCWLFRGEYMDALTGAIFDIYVSFLGTVINTE